MGVRFTRSSALMLLAFALIAHFAAIESNTSARSALLRPEVKHRIPQNQAAAAGAVSATDRLGKHYLMLVNTAMASKMDAQKMAQFDRSPYDGLAVSFADAYDTSPVLSAATMEAQMSSLKNSTTKDIWP
jgi:hypothetical protein